jgi:hypothetical protein
MIYIEENSKIVNFPKISNESFDKIHFVNQVTNTAFDLITDNGGNLKNIYEVDISPVIMYFERGQYDYSFQKFDGTIVSSGILQFDSYGNTVIEYVNKPRTIQYNSGDTNYVEIDRTIKISENNTYNVEDYDTAVVNVKGSGGSMKIAKAFTKEPYISHNQMDGQTVYFADSLSLTNPIYFALDCDLKTAYTEKDYRYFTISRYNSNRRKYTVLNDSQLHLPIAKMYCWKYDNWSDHPEDWTYFYTAVDYNNNPEFAYQKFAWTWIAANPNAYELDHYWNDVENYVTNLHQLRAYYDLPDWLSEEDLSRVSRVPKYDVDNVFIDCVGKNFLEHFFENYGYSMEEWADKKEKLNCNVNDEFLNLLKQCSIFVRGEDQETGADIWSYRSFCGDVPIEPVKLADCLIAIDGKLTEKYGYEHGEQIWVRFGDLTLEEVEQIQNPYFKAPYTGNEIIARLYIVDNDLREEFGYYHRNAKWKERILYDDFYGAARRSGKKYISDIDMTSSKGCSVYVKFGLATEEQVKSGNYNSLIEYPVKMILRGQKYFNWVDNYYDYTRPAILIKIMQ